MYQASEWMSIFQVINDDLYNTMHYTDYKYGGSFVGLRNRGVALEVRVLPHFKQNASYEVQVFILSYRVCSVQFEHFYILGIYCFYYLVIAYFVISPNELNVPSDDILG